MRRPELATTSHAAAAVTSPDYAADLRRLRDAFAGGRTHSLKWRAAQLTALETLLTDCEKDLLAALREDLGKPPMEAWMTEISAVAAEAAYCRRHLDRWTHARRVRTPLVAQPGRSWIQPEPLGVVLIIGAWNYPLQLTLAALAAAIAAGNCAVVKPSELAPHSSALLADRLPDFLDRDCFRIIEGGADETTALLEQKFDHILYTGGARVGRIVMSAAARHLTPVTLELGGKSPCVVLPDADLGVAARRIAWGKFTNAGQTCIAPDYVLTDAATEARLLPLLMAAIRDMYGDDPAQSTSYGRIVNGAQFERLKNLLGSGRLAFGGQSNEAERYIAPTILTDVAPDSPAMQEEIFGPILPVVRVGNADEARRFIAGRDKPLAAYLFTDSHAAEVRFLDEVSAGNVCINDTLMFMAAPELPFGGVGASGMGAYSGEWGFRTFSHMKAVMKRAWWPDVALRYAPYTEKKWRWLRRLR
ncbi:MAG TPA: aldehyde dehydrogenase family protein [Woeseiaceae bacterium]|nr:aldehyde dehydrogenase family protein [Woeseiaceae bacterium]